MSSASNPDNFPVFLLCGDTAQNPGRSGIQTVVRSLAAAFGSLGSPVRPVVWHRGKTRTTLRPLPAARPLGLGAEALREPPPDFRTLLRRPVSSLAYFLAGGRAERLPIQRVPRRRAIPRGAWILLPELLYREDLARTVVDCVHRQGWRLAAIVHDLIPVQHPGFVPPALPGEHAEYLRGLSRADLILTDSAFTARDWHEFVAREGLPTPPVQVCTLACDLPGIARVRVAPALAPASGKPAAVRLLCVSTLEPRKNHRALLAAYELAAARRPDLPLELDLVGASYVGADDIADAVRALVRRHPGRVRWHERVEHHALQRLYAACDFTVYPSVVEGFGLPVLESLWFARPCVCADFGAMAETAAGGGCLTVDVRDPAALADALLRLTTSPVLRHRLAAEATTRRLKTWREYATELLDALRAHS